MRLNWSATSTPTAWTVSHAFAMLLAVALAAALRRPGLLAAVALPSFALLCAGTWGRWTACGAFGAANAVTALRIGLVAACVLDADRIAAPLLGGVLLLVFALDGLDGLLARRAGSISSFGALFDMEADAFFVAVASMLAWRSELLGAWVLSAGVLRYGYVICLTLVPARREELPRSRYARWAFSLLVSALIGVWWLPPQYGRALGAAGVGAVWLSFLRGFLYSYARVSA